MTNEKLLPQAIPTTILKNDVRGRVLTPPEEREALLDAFESQNELSAPKFAEQRGINYQTFATWRQKRAKLQQQRQATRSALGPSPAFAEVVLSAASFSTEEGAASGLAIELPGGCRLHVQRPDEVALAAALIQALARPQVQKV